MSSSFCHTVSNAVMPIGTACLKFHTHFWGSQGAWWVHLWSTGNLVTPSGLQIDVGIGLWDTDTRATAEETSKTGENRFEEDVWKWIYSKNGYSKQMGLSRNLWNYETHQLTLFQALRPQGQTHLIDAFAQILKELHIVFCDPFFGFWVHVFFLSINWLMPAGKTLKETMSHFGKSGVSLVAKSSTLSTILWSGPQPGLEVVRIALQIGVATPNFWPPLLGRLGSVLTGALHCMAWHGRVLPVWM